MPAAPLVSLCKSNCLTSSAAIGPFLSQVTKFLSFGIVIYENVKTKKIFYRCNESDSNFGKAKI